MKAYACIGGPLDGEYATSEDFYGYRPINPETKKPYRHGERLPDGRWPFQRDEGMYAHLKNEYVQFNNSGGSKTSAVWIHTTLLRPPISARRR